jgi:hypothetical protein
MDLAGVWVRRFVYLTITIVVVAAPILGVVAVPKFRPLVSAFPESSRGLMTVLMGVLIGVVAIAVRFLGTVRMKKRSKQIAGGVCLAGVVVAVVVIAAHLNFWVVEVAYNGGDDTAQFVVGGNERRASCRCPVEDSAAACIEGLSFDPAKISSCWGDRSINKAKFILTLEYLAALLLLSLAVAFLVLTEDTSLRPEESKPPG